MITLFKQNLFDCVGVSACSAENRSCYLFEDWVTSISFMVSYIDTYSCSFDLNDSWPFAYITTIVTCCCDQHVRRTRRNEQMRKLMSINHSVKRSFFPHPYVYI